MCFLSVFFSRFSERSSWSFSSPYPGSWPSWPPSNNSRNIREHSSTSTACCKRCPGRPPWFRTSCCRTTPWLLSVSSPDGSSIDEKAIRRRSEVLPQLQLWVDAMVGTRRGRYRTSDTRLRPCSERPIMTTRTGWNRRFPSPVMEKCRLAEVEPIAFFHEATHSGFRKCSSTLPSTTFHYAQAYDDDVTYHRAESSCRLGNSPSSGWTPSAERPVIKTFGEFGNAEKTRNQSSADD